jgi:hypothetical protein
MTSRDQQGARGSARFIWLAAGILAAVAAYSGGWFYVGGIVEENVDETVRRTSEAGGEASCSNREARGYPFRIGLFCDDVSFTDPQATIEVTGRGLRTAAQVYNPFKVVGELDALKLQLAESPAGIAWAANDIRFSAVLGQPLPERASVTVRDISIDSAPDSGRGTAIATAPTGEAHMRSREGDLDVAIEASDLRLVPQGIPEGVVLSRVFADLTVEDGVRLAETRPDSLRGTSVVVRSASAMLGDDAGVTISGPVAVDLEGLVDARLEIEMRNPAKLAEALSAALPRHADQIRTAMAGFAMLGDGASLPLTIDKGRARIAFVTLGQLPPLR